MKILEVFLKQSRGGVSGSGLLLGGEGLFFGDDLMSETSDVHSHRD